MEALPSVSMAMAFVAGLLSFASPCVLPIGPSFLGFISGLTFEQMTGQEERRGAPVLLYTAWFVAGFSLVFVALGASATFLGALLRYASRWVSAAGGVLLILFGLYLIGVLRLPGAGREWRMHLAEKPVGYLGTFLVGVTFGAGWTPCIGPVLGGILTMASERWSM